MRRFSLAHKRPVRSRRQAIPGLTQLPHWLLFAISYSRQQQALLLLPLLRAVRLVCRGVGVLQQLLLNGLRLAGRLEQRLVRQATGIRGLHQRSVLGLSLLGVSRRRKLQRRELMGEQPRLLAATAWHN